MDTNANPNLPRRLFLFLAMNKMVVAAAALLAAITFRVRRRTRGLTSYLISAWKGLGDSKVVSGGDLLFLFCLLTLWSCLYVVCMWDDPIELVSGVTSVPLVVAEAVGGAISSTALYLPSVSSAFMPKRVASPGSPPAPSFDQDSVMKQLLSSPEFKSRMEELAKKYTAPIRADLVSYSDQKIQDIEALLRQGEKFKEQELKHEIEVRLKELKEHTNQRIDESIKELSQSAERDHKMTTQTLTKEIEELRRRNGELLSRAGDDSQEAARIKENLRELQAKVETLDSMRSDFEARVKTCCKAGEPMDATALRAEVESAVDSWIDGVVSGDSSSLSPAAERFRQYLKTEYVSQAEAEAVVERLARSLSLELRTEMLTWAEKNAVSDSAATVEQIMRNSTLVAMFREKIADDLNQLSALQGTSASSSSASFSSDQEILSAIHEALRVYDADKTGKFDFALESAGGTIASTRCTETYDVSNAVYSVFGIPFWWEKNNPRTILQPGSNPGECWAFKGSRGEVVIRLSSPIYPEAVSLEHIPRMAAPDQTISSAPKRFSIWGLETLEDEEPMYLGVFTYEDNNKPVQTFELDNSRNQSKPFSLIELKVHSNHGNVVYTCVYRLRVHGKITGMAKS